MAYRIVDLRDFGDARTAGPRWDPHTVGTGIGNMVALVGAWRERARQRRHLRELPPRLLRDIGIDRLTALAEARKPFWRP